MAFQHRLGIWAMLLLQLLAGTAVAAKLNTCSTGTISDGARCLARQGTSYLSGFCSTVLTITTPTSTETSAYTATVYEDSTVTTGTQTITAKPITDFATRTNTINPTTTITDVSTQVTATITSFNVTTTTTSTSFSYIYTCGAGGSSLPISSSSLPVISSSIPLGTGSVLVPSISSSSGPRGNLSVSATPPSYGTGWSSPSVVPRAVEAFTSPPCVRSYKNEYGRNGLRNACGCFAFPTPKPTTVTVTTVDPSTTITSTTAVEVEATTSVTPTVTKTKVSSTTVGFSVTETSTTSIATIAYATFTQTKVITSIIATSSPTPASFNIFYIDSTDNSTAPHSNFFQAVTAPSGHGIVIANDADADSFGIDPQGRLLDFTVGLFMVRNTDDVYPWEFLVAGAQTDNTPICSACNGVLSCDYPGTFGNTFAICNGFLALGDPGVFGQDADSDGTVDCRAIALQYK